MTNVLNPGEVVRLKSGGFAMTVERIEGANAICSWQDEDGTLKSSRCALCELVSVDEELFLFG